MDEFQEVQYIFDRLRVEYTSSTIRQMVKFSGPNIIEIDISGQRISKLPMDIFDRLEIIEKLDLSNNFIQHLEPDIFHRLTNLKILKLSGNLLEVLDIEQFKSLNDLKELYLQQNQLKKLPNGIFDNTSDLTVLNLSKNNLTSLPESMKSLEKLEWLNLRENNLPNHLNRQLIMKNQVQRFLRRLN